jgi:hypothetical protein
MKSLNSCPVKQAAESDNTTEGTPHSGNTRLFKVSITSLAFVPEVGSRKTNFDIRSTSTNICLNLPWLAGAFPSTPVKSAAKTRNGTAGVG